MRYCISFILACALVLTPAQATQSPDITRSDFATALWQALGAIPCEVSHPFSDLCAQENITAISWCYQEGLMVGTGSDQFSPSALITREEVAVLLRRTALWLGCPTEFIYAPLGLSLCNDNEGISPWADDSLYWTCTTGLMDWSPGGRLDPLGHVTEDSLADIFQVFFAL